MTGAASQPKVMVLLATCNGRLYLEEQITSIRRQKGVEWRLLIRDDGSSDETVALLRALAADDKRIVLIDDDFGRLGVGANFAALAEHALAKGDQYIAFADQDDVWQPDKLATQMKMMLAAEARHPHTPLLVYSDLEVVDEGLRSLAPSFMKYQGIRHEARDSLKVLLAQNFVTGCAMLVNRRLLQVALPLPAASLLHDWWFALCAAVFGRLLFIDQPLVKYRQHGANQVGVKPWRRLFSPLGGRAFRQWRQGKKRLWDSLTQAEALASRIRGRAADFPAALAHLALLDGYARLVDRSPLARLAWLRRAGVHCQHPGRQALLISRLLLG